MMGGVNAGGLVAIKSSPSLNQVFRKLKLSQRENKTFLAFLSFFIRFTFLENP
jgi:hypothetical protein